MQARRWWLAKLSVLLATVVVLVTGCDAMNPFGSGVSEPMTPEESRAQVVDAARGVVATLDLDVVEAFFWHASCNDQGASPFRGRVRIAYPKAASFEESDREIAQMVERLRDDGWDVAQDFHTHGSALQKNNVVAELSGQNVSTRNRNIHIFGECRDVTTPKGHYPSEDLDLG